MYSELAFLIKEASGGGYQAGALGHSILAEADSLAELKEAVRDAVRCHFEDHQDQLRRGRGRRDRETPRLAPLLGRYEYRITRQTRSHLRLTTLKNGEHYPSLPTA